MTNGFLTGVLVVFLVYLVAHWQFCCRRARVQERLRAELEQSQPARQVSHEEWDASLRAHGLFGYCPKCGVYQGCNGGSECISCGYTASRMVALDDVIERLEQGFGKGCAPVTTLLHHFGGKS